MSVLDDTIAQIAAATTVEASATAFILGVPALIQTAVAEALANGATEAQLAPLTDLNAQLKAKSEALQAALTANTPQA